MVVARPRWELKTIPLLLVIHRPETSDGYVGRRDLDDLVLVEQRNPERPIDRDEQLVRADRALVRDRTGALHGAARRIDPMELGPGGRRDPHGASVLDQPVGRRPGLVQR